MSFPDWMVEVEKLLRPVGLEFLVHGWRFQKFPWAVLHEKGWAPDQAVAEACLRKGLNPQTGKLYDTR